MAKSASKWLFLFLLSLLGTCSSGTLVGFCYHTRGNAVPSDSARTLSLLQQNKVSPSQIRVFASDFRVLSALHNTGSPVDLYLKEDQVKNLISSNPSAVSWLKTHILTHLPFVNFKSIVLSSVGNEFHGQSQLLKLLSNLKSIHSVLVSFGLEEEVKVSVAFSSAFLEKLKGNSCDCERHLQSILGFVIKTRSFIIIEASIHGEESMGDRLVQSVVERAALATTVLHCEDVPMLLTIQSSPVPKATELIDFADKVAKCLETTTQIITSRIAGLYAEVPPSMEDFAEKELEREKEQIFPSSHRELLNSFKTSSHDVINPPTAFPTIPISTAPVTIPPYNPTPTIVTVPATNPVSTTPANPTSTPQPIPTTTPVTVPSTNPNNPTVPITNPVTTPAPITVPGAQPVTNPVTTYPAPAGGGIPVTTPVTTNPVAPPATTNAPAIPGQSWCIARTGALETALQAALDYACGMGGADCSQIQQSGSCYNPNSLENHASYAFNSYYQKNPSPTSCDFGGTAIIVSANPSSGSCIYPSSASASTSPTTPAATPATPATPAVSSSGTGVSGSGTPPTVLNSSSPAGSGTTTVFGSDTPPNVSTSTSKSAALRPFVGSIIMVASFVAGAIIRDM